MREMDDDWPDFPGDVHRGSGDGDATPIEDRGLDPETFAVVREELRSTFEYQVKRLQEIDSKAIEILKANLLLIGIVVTGGSILVQTDLEIGPFLNPFTVVGGLLLLASTGLAAVTYTASNLRGGLDADAVETTLAIKAARTRSDGAGDGAEVATGSVPGFDERLLRSYARWIEYNARVTAVNDMLATVTVLSVFVAFIFVVAGVVVAAIGLSPLAVVAAFIAVTAIVTAFGWVAYHMDHIGIETEPWPNTFEGIRLSKGASRERGLQDLLGMVRRPPPDDNGATSPVTDVSVDDPER